MLGRINWLEIRLYLSGMGILSCLMGLGAAMGLTFLFGLEYNQTHNVLPFIAIGKSSPSEHEDCFKINSCVFQELELMTCLSFRSAGKISLLIQVKNL